MAHEITATDHVMLTKNSAWHGMGTIVRDAPNAVAALGVAKLDWTVSGYPVHAHLPDGRTIQSSSKIMNVRDDTLTELGMVTANYERFQNREVAEFIDDLCEQDDTIKIETAGSIQGGKKIWFLIQGESFEVRGDETKEYILASNGFDGGTSLRFTPTSVRVVCSNTLHMVIPRTEAEGRSRLDDAGFSLSHRGLLRNRLEQVKNALGLYGRAVQHNRDMIIDLASKDVTTEEVKQFFMDCYVRHFGAINMSPGDKTSSRKKNNALDAFADYSKRFDEESEQFGASRWVMLNAYTGMIQHAGNTFGGMSERSVSSNLFGVAASRSIQALEIALSA